MPIFVNSQRFIHAKISTFTVFTNYTVFLQPNVENSPTGVKVICGMRPENRRRGGGGGEALSVKLDHLFPNRKGL